MKKVFVFTSVHQWNDVRIFHKEATSLSKHFDVELHAPADFEHKLVGSINVYGLPKWVKVSDRKIIRAELWKRIKKTEADIFHFHDPELIFIGFYLKIFLKKKVIFDVHENVSLQILNKDYIPTKFLRKLVSVFFSIIERIAVKTFNGVVVAGGDILSMCSKRTVINNYPIINKLVDEKPKADNTIAYLGGITKIRGVEEVLKAIRIVNKKTNRNLRMKLIGEFSDKAYKDYILNEYSNIIDFLGWVERTSALNETRKSIIGIVLYLPVPNHMYLRSNKIFEYMEAGIPVLFSNFEDWKHRLDDFNVGLSADPTDPNDIANQILWILDNPAEANKMGVNGSKTIVSTFNWDIEKNKLIDLYMKIIQNEK
jgi:glycosyltransferase involved in cell wall biosynthesis